MRIPGSLVPLLIPAVLAAGPEDRARGLLTGLPLAFVENYGLYPEEVAFYVQGSHKTVFFTPTGLTFRLRQGGTAWVVKLEFLGARPVRPRGEERRTTVVSYFRGRPETWRTGLRTYGRLVYADLWPGIDLIYETGPARLKYAFRVHPGADPGRIRLRLRGATVRLLAAGALAAETPVGRLEDERPRAYEDAGDVRRPVPAAFLLHPTPDGAEVGFRLGPYDRRRLLVVDPSMFVYCGYLGGDAGDAIRAIAYDAAGNAYITGETWSDQFRFPVKVGPDRTHNGAVDAFVAKVNAQGTALVDCGYLGGNGSDAGRAIAVDATGDAHPHQNPSP